MATPNVTPTSTTSVRAKRQAKKPARYDDDAFVAHREESDWELALQLRRQGKINSPGKPFEESDAAELNALLGSGVLKPVLYNHDEHSGTRIFKSRMVREIKGRATPRPYEKSRLVVQGYGDDEKRGILTQSPTIQRCSQRLILALAPALRQLGMTLAIRDITQAYTQSKSSLNRLVLAHLPQELKGRYPQGTILRVVKPLYGIAEAGVHWFETYQRHHKERLRMSTSAFDACLMVTTEENQDDGTRSFGIVGMQTDDTLIVGSSQFLTLEDNELKKANFKAKPRETLTPGTTTDFNGGRLHVEEDNVTMVQKGQAEKLSTVKDNDDDRAQQYVEQRARGAYIASICQPEASFDYSVARASSRTHGRRLQEAE